MLTSNINQWEWRQQTLTNERDDDESEVQSSRELPLFVGVVVRLGPQKQPSNVVKVLVGDVVEGLDVVLLLQQRPFAVQFVIRLQSVEHGGSYQEVGEGTHYQGQGPHVLALHLLPMFQEFLSFCLCKNNKHWYAQNDIIPLYHNNLLSWNREWNMIR